MTALVRKDRRRTPVLEDFGAVAYDEDPTFDNTLAIQRALDARIPIHPYGKTYRHTGELVAKHGSKIYGAGNWSGVASTQSSVGVTRFLYDGPGGANSCIVRMSDAAVGVDPAVAATRDLQNVALKGVLLDGNGKAEFGLYMVRAWSNNELDFITVTGTTRHAFWAAKCWNGSPRNWHAFKNRGAGITLGKNSFGWGSAAVDQSVCNSFFGYYNGCDSAGAALNVFDEAANRDREYGIGVWGGRGLVMLNAQAAQNSGAGIFASPLFKPVLFEGGYCEGNGRSSNSSRAWDLWFEGEPAQGSHHCVFDAMNLGLATATRLTGTEPSRHEAGPKFVNMPLLGTIVADWDNYRLIDSDRNVVVVGEQPSGFAHRTGGGSGAGMNLGAAGVAVFDASAGAINLLMREGIIASVVYVAAGTYDVTLARPFSSARYGISLTTGDNKRIGHSNVTVNGFRILHRDAAGVLSDAGARITVETTGYWT